MTSSAEWYRSHALRCRVRVEIASKTRPFSRTQWPPAPSASQYNCTAASGTRPPEGVLAETVIELATYTILDGRGQGVIRAKQKNP
jgi:hypothetical protein